MPATLPNQSLNFPCFTNSPIRDPASNLLYTNLLRSQVHLFVLLAKLYIFQFRHLISSLTDVAPLLALLTPVPVIAAVHLRVQDHPPAHPPINKIVYRPATPKPRQPSLPLSSNPDDNRLASFAVPSSSTTLLRVICHLKWHLHMHHHPNIWNVDA
ncbi:hypothetical protein NW761_015168 [Fusarium oxysporum]|nr:hypothetical protein NW761_015168 [Fusarium oxysporum]